MNYLRYNDGAIMGKSKLGKIVSNMLKKTERRLEDVSYSIEDALDPAKTSEDKFYRKAARISKKAERIGEDLDDAANELLHSDNGELGKWLQQLADDVTDTTKGLADGIKNGEAVTSLRKALQDLFDSVSKAMKGLFQIQSKVETKAKHPGNKEEHSKKERREKIESIRAKYASNKETQAKGNSRH